VIFDAQIQNIATIQTRFNLICIITSINQPIDFSSTADAAIGSGGVRVGQQAKGQQGTKAYYAPGNLNGSLNSIDCRLSLLADKVHSYQAPCRPMTGVYA
jgi:hypothetical protein